MTITAREPTLNKSVPRSVLWGRCGAGAVVIMRMDHHLPDEVRWSRRSDRHHPDPADRPIRPTGGPLNPRVRGSSPWRRTHLM
jgi:hypothetical protein